MPPQRLLLWYWCAVSSPFARAITVAAAIHVVVVGGAALYARSMPPVSPPDEVGAAPWLDLALVELPRPVVPPADPAPSDEAGEEVPEPRRVAMRVPDRGRKAPNPGEPGPGGGDLGAVLDSSEPDPSGIHGGGQASGKGPGDGGGEGDGTDRPIDLGLDRGLPWLWTQPVRPPPRPRPASTTGGLRELLDARDRKLGLGFGGPIVSAFHSAAATPSAPQNGRARFEAIIDASGRAASVRVVSADGDRTSWQAVAEQVLRILRARILRVPSDGDGIAIVLDVRSRHQLPSGSKPGKPIELKGAGAQFDLSDIGAVPSHNLAVHVVSERRL